MNTRFKAFGYSAFAAVLAANSAYAATITQPTTILYGGGATLPAIAYIGTNWLGSSPNLRLSNTLPPAAGTSSNGFAAGKDSLFNQYVLTTATGTSKQGVVGLSYCQTGSGAGRRILTGDISKGETSAKGVCGDYSGTPVGFSSTSTVTDFAASDVGLSSGEISTFVTNAGASASGNSLNPSTAPSGSPYVAPTGAALRVQPVQIPAVAGAVAIVYNNAALTEKHLNLTQSDICGIFSGSITDWSALTHTPKAGTPATKPIKVIYRYDGSGTSFSFTNYLSKVCGNLSAKDDHAVSGFNTTDTFSGTGGSSSGSKKAFSGFTTGLDASNNKIITASPVGSSFTGISGNGNMVNTVANTDGAIGYAELSDAIARAKVLGGGNLKYATVSYAADQDKSSYTCDLTTTPACGTGHIPAKTTTVSVPAIVYNKMDPGANFLTKGTTAFAVTAKGDEVLTGTSDSTGRPTTGSATVPSGGVAGCLALVEPDTYAAPTAGSVAKYDAKALKDGSFLTIMDYDRYPITAISYLMAYNGGNSTKKDTLKNLLKAPFTSTVLAKTKTIGKTTGYAPLALTLGTGTAAPGTAAAAQIDACVLN